MPQADKIARAAHATLELAGMLIDHADARIPGRSVADPPARPAARRGHDAARRRISAEGDQRSARQCDRGVHDGDTHRGSRGASRGRGQLNRGFRTAPSAAGP